VRTKTGRAERITDHRDLGPSPRFDRLILATALAEEMPVIFADEKFQRYQPLVAVIW
jgi:PIN domain nuclease of toxin-antitoxin system